jgi:hypothetical protein
MEQMPGARRSERLLARFEEVAGDNRGGMLLTQLEREAAGAVEGMSREEDSVEAEDSEEVKEAEVAREGVDPHTTPRENRSTSLSLSRNPSLREELA